MESANEWLKFLKEAVPLVAVLLKIVVGIMNASRHGNESLAIYPQVAKTGLQDVAQPPEEPPTHLDARFGDYSVQDLEERSMMRGPRSCQTHAVAAILGQCRPVDCSKRRKPIYMQFVRESYWHVTFFEEDRKTPLPLSVVFHDEGKLINTARRGGADFTPAGRDAFDNALRKGCGGAWLWLTEAQYSRLLRSSNHPVAA